MDKKLLISYVIGTSLEIYEFTVFGLMAGILATHFFSEYETNLQMQLIFIMFAIGFIVRPIGAIFYGQWGDRKGRRTPFLSTIVLMAIATFMIGLLPTYETIGWVSTFLLLLLRVVQGIAVSGEYPGAVTLLYEQNNSKNAKIYTSLMVASTFLGMLLASLTVLILNKIMGEMAFKDWGWRVPFLIAFFLGGIAVWFRKKMEESPQFLLLQDNKEIPKNKVKTLLKDNIGSIAIMVAIYQLSVILSYTAFVYLPNARILLFPDEFSHVYMATSINLILTVVLIPIFAYLLPDKKTTTAMVSSALLVGISVLLIFKWVNQSGWGYFLMAQGILAVLGSLFVSCFPYLMAKTFPTHSRYLGNGIVLNLTSGVFAGVTPYLLTLIVGETGSSLMPAVYIMVSSMLSLIGLIYFRYRNLNIASKELSL